LELVGYALGEGFEFAVHREAGGGFYFVGPFGKDFVSPRLESAVNRKGTVGGTVDYMFAIFRGLLSERFLRTFASEMELHLMGYVVLIAKMRFTPSRCTVLKSRVRANIFSASCFAIFKAASVSSSEYFSTELPCGREFNANKAF